MSAVLFNDLLLADGRKITEIKLNVPQALNALSKEMIDLVRQRLDEIIQDDTVVAVILDGAGEKAFCAGGDVVKLYHAIEGEIDQPYIEAWFMAEYAMDYLIHNFPKPIIGWGSGIVMGGGLGMLSGCSHRVVTETTRMAMPEVSIALYPDVAASWFFNRMHQGVGLFLGLTACQLNAADALFLGLADRYIHSDKRQVLTTALQQADWQDEPHQVVSRVLKQLALESQTQSLPESPIRKHYDAILRVTDHAAVVDIVEAILQYPNDDDWWCRVQSTLRQGSPLAAYLIYQQLLRCRHKSLKEAFMEEMVLTTRCCLESELKEGIRALLVDKDKQPQWLFSSLAEIDDVYAQRFFEPPWSENPLRGELDRVDHQVSKKSATCQYFAKP